MTMNAFFGHIFACVVTLGVCVGGAFDAHAQRAEIAPSFSLAARESTASTPDYERRAQRHALCDESFLPFLKQQMQAAQSAGDWESYTALARALSARLAQYIISCPAPEAEGIFPHVVEHIQSGLMTPADRARLFSFLENTLNEQRRCEAGGTQCMLLGYYAMTLSLSRDRGQLYAPAEAPAAQGNETLARRTALLRDLLQNDYGAAEATLQMQTPLLAALAYLGGYEAIRTPVKNIVLAGAGKTRYAKNRYEAGNYRAQRAAMELLAALGPQARKDLEAYALAYYTRASALHANVALAYVSDVTPPVKRLVRQNIRHFYCTQQTQDPALDLELRTLLAHAYWRGEPPAQLTAPEQEGCTVVRPVGPDPQLLAQQWAEKAAWEAVWWVGGGELVRGAAKAYQALKTAFKAAKLNRAFVAGELYAQTRGALFKKVLAGIAPEKNAVAAGQKVLSQPAVAAAPQSYGVKYWTEQVRAFGGSRVEIMEDMHLLFKRVDQLADPAANMQLRHRLHVLLKKREAIQESYRKASGMKRAFHLRLRYVDDPALPSAAFFRPRAVMLEIEQTLSAQNRLTAPLVGQLKKRLSSTPFKLHQDGAGAFSLLTTRTDYRQMPHLYRQLLGCSPRQPCFYRLVGGKNLLLYSPQRNLWLRVGTHETQKYGFHLHLYTETVLQSGGRAEPVRLNFRLQVNDVRLPKSSPNYSLGLKESGLPKHMMEKLSAEKYHYCVRQALKNMREAALAVPLP